MSGWFRGWRSWWRGIALLRYPELIHYLGERRFHLAIVAGLRGRFPDSRISDDIVLTEYEDGRLVLSSGVSLCDGTVLAFGDPRNGFGRIVVGAGTWVGPYNNLRASGGGDIVIGESCLISQFCSLVGSNHATARGRPILEQEPDRRRLGVTLGGDVWLGAGVSVMPGVTIGTGAVIGANSVVTHNVPAYEIWAGCPARRISERAD